METREILEKVKGGKLSIEEAERYFKRQAFEELGYAKLDSHREVRSGFPEVIFCSGKPEEYLVSIYQKLYEANGEVLGTRADVSQFEAVRAVLPQVTYDEISHILKVEKKDKERIGKIAVCTAGTADISVAEEAAQTAEFLEEMWNGFMMWESAVFTDCSIVWMSYRMPIALSRLQAWKGLLPAFWEAL